jgi:hypothetical protein
MKRTFDTSPPWADAELAVKALLAAREHWSRHVSCGFSASEVASVTRTHVALTDGRRFKLDALNRRELEEVWESMKLHCD